MTNKLRWLVLILLSMTIGIAQAQDSQPTAIVLQMGADGIPQVGEVQLPGASLFVDWNPQDANSWARVDDFGMLRFAPLGSAEGVYTFSPYFQGYSTPSREENRLFVDEVKWSPNGQQLAFRISSGNSMGNDGVWFWQPAIETATDPSYHLLRDCPPGCGLANARDTNKWKSLSMDWSPDNVAILVHMFLPDEERRALGIIYASRDPESPQADVQPQTLRFEYGSWLSDGIQLVVSGYDVDNNSVFGMIPFGTGGPVVKTASEIGLAYVRNAVMKKPETGEFLMLGSPISDTSPMALYDSNGTALTPLIGNQAPDDVEWSPNHDAVLVKVGQQTYIATITGEVYDATQTVNSNPMVSWVEAGFPPNTTPLSLPAPTIVQATATPVKITITAETLLPENDDSNTAQTLFVPQTDFQAGQLLQVATEKVTLYREPVAGAEVIAELEQGTAFVLISNPLTDGVTVWWRIQTLDFIGWAEEKVNGISQFSP